MERNGRAVGGGGISETARIQEEDGVVGRGDGRRGSRG